MGISSKSTKSKTNQTTSFNNTTTPTNPDFVTNGLAGVGQTLTDLNAVDPYSLVAGPDKLQTQAGAGASALESPQGFNIGSGILQDVAGAGPQRVQGADASSLIGKFLDPYLNDVVNTSLADYDYGAGKQMGQANLDLANDTTFGGSGGALFKRGVADDITRGRGTLSAGLRSQGFNTALQAALQQAQMDNGVGSTNAGLAEQALSRRGDAGRGIADIAGAQGANDRANIGTQASVGEMLRQIQQAMAGAPISKAGALASLWQTLPLDLLHGQNSSGSGSLQGTTTSKTSGASLGDWLGLLAANVQAAGQAAAGGA